VLDNPELVRKLLSEPIEEKERKGEHQCSPPAL